MITNLRAQLVAHGLPERQIHAEEFGFAKRGPEAAPPPVEPPEPREPLPPASKLPAVLFALAFAVFAFAGGVLVGQSRSSGGAAATGRRPSTPRRRPSRPGRPSTARRAAAPATSSPPRAPRARSARTSTTRSPTPREVIDVVTNGKGVMPSYRDRLTTKQIEQLAAFVSTSAGS